MPRMLRRAAVLGATAHVASKRGEARAAASAPEDSYDELMKLKGLLDAGVLTQAEFDAEKQKILSA